MPEAPTCSCALLCDDVLESKRGKHILQGIIGAILVPQFPAPVGGYVAYIRLSNVYGSQKVMIALEDDGGTKIFFQGEVTITGSANPLDVYNVVETVPVVTIDRPGRYLFSVKYDGVSLASTPIVIQGPVEEGRT